MSESSPNPSSNGGADPQVRSGPPGPLERPDQEVHATMRKRGSLRVYLGYAAGVGKTYQMLDEAQKMHAGGVDVVIGYFEPHGRKDTIQKTEGMETIPRQKIAYRGATFEEMD